MLQWKDSRQKGGNPLTLASVILVCSTVTSTAGLMLQPTPFHALDGP